MVAYCPVDSESDGGDDSDDDSDRSDGDGEDNGVGDGGESSDPETTYRGNDFHSLHFLFFLLIFMF